MGGRINDMAGHKKIKDLPLNMPCSDPEGCKHFKNEIKLRERIKELEEENKQLKGTRKCSCGKSIFYYTYCKRCRELWEK